MFFLLFFLILGGIRLLGRGKKSFWKPPPCSRKPVSLATEASFTSAIKAVPITALFVCSFVRLEYTLMKTYVCCHAFRSKYGEQHGGSI